MVVPDQIDQVGGAIVPLGGRGRGAGGRRKRRGGESRTEQARAAYQTAAAEPLGVERLCGNLGVGPFGHGAVHAGSSPSSWTAPGRGPRAVPGRIAWFRNPAVNPD
ncbi:hypothetical protein GCM10018966_015230 [Streptomyces yanii]